MESSAATQLSCIVVLKGKDESNEDYGKRCASTGLRRSRREDDPKCEVVGDRCEPFGCRSNLGATECIKRGCAYKEFDNTDGNGQGSLTAVCYDDTAGDQISGDVEKFAGGCFGWSPADDADPNDGVDMTGTDDKTWKE